MLENVEKKFDSSLAFPSQQKFENVEKHSFLVKKLYVHTRFLPVELKEVTKKFGFESIFDIFFRKNLMRMLENVEKSLTFRQLFQANRSLKTLKNTRFQSKSCMSTHVSYRQSAKKDHFFLILETSLESSFQTQNMLHFEASKIKLKIVASKLKLWV